MMDPEDSGLCAEVTCMASEACFRAMKQLEVQSEAEERKMIIHPPIHIDAENLRQVFVIDGSEWRSGSSCCVREKYI